MQPEAVDPIVQIRATPRTSDASEGLAALLRHDAPHFQGLSTADAQRLRGQLFAEFEGRPHPLGLREMILEELQTSLSPVVLAGAARALRNETADPVLLHWLSSSHDRIALLDDYVALDCPGPDRLTARGELAETLQRWQSPKSSCCAGPGLSETTIPCAMNSSPGKLCPKKLATVTLEDQHGAKVPLVSLLRTRPSLIAFFYTRCMNPEKCSLTVLRLAALARQIEAVQPGGWNILAISYDPEFDTPLQLRRFGEGRDFPFSEHARLIRCVTDWPKLQQAFDLRVGYSAATVNEHARECFYVTPGLDLLPLSPERLADPASTLNFAFKTRFSDAV